MDPKTPDYIYFAMHGTATATPVQAYLIVYGVKDWSDNVDPRVMMAPIMKCLNMKIIR